MEMTYLVGIDPSFENTGVAIYHPGTKTYTLKTGDLFDALDFLNEQGVFRKSIIVLENPNLDNSFFLGWNWIKNSVVQFQQRRMNLADVESEVRKAMKMAMNVGSSKSSGTLWLKIFEKYKIPVIQIKPSDRHRADKKALGIAGVQMLHMPTKTTAKQFTDLTGHVGRSSEHARDAATLVWNRNIKWAEMMLQMQAQ